MSLAFLTLGFFAAPSAQAQGSYPGGGNGGYPGGGPPPPPPDPGHYWKISYAFSNVVNSHQERDVPSVGESTSTVSGGGSTIIDGDDEYTVTTTLKWIPAAGDPNDMPPEPVRIEEFSDAAYGSAWGGVGPQPGPSGTADNGLGDPAGPGMLGTESKGTHLLRRDGSSGTIVLDAVTLRAINPVSTWTSYPNSPGNHYWDWTGGYNTIMFDVSVVDDNRSVSISSPIEDSYAKGPADEFGYFTSSPDIRNSDGSITVDSAVQWEEASIYSIEGWHVDNLPLTATPVNFFSSIPSYSWSLQGLPQGWLTVPTGNPTFFSLVEPDWKQFPLQGTVTVDATDSDGVTVFNTYTMRLHLPVENWRSIGADFPVWQLSP